MADKDAGTLVLTYTITVEQKVRIFGGTDGVARAVTDLTRDLHGAWGIDPESIRFRVEK